MTTRKLRRWLGGSPARTDAAIALSCFLLAAPVSAATAYHRDASIGGYLLLLLASCLPLLARSRRPVAVAACTVAIGVAELLLVPLAPGRRPESLGISMVAVGFALYAVGTRTDRRTAWRTGCCAAAALTLTALIVRPGLEELPQNLGLIAWPCLSVAIGDAVRSRRELLASAVERAERAERTREEEARRRVTEERMRIARELHDVVAHHITLVNTQAGVAHHLMRTDPDHAYQALERIRDTSRAALDELRATVGLLRHSGDQAAAAPREPAPGLAGLDDLLDAFRHSGLAVTLERSGPATGAPAGPAADGLPPITDLTAYRIIQEALTNTHKHAGPATAVVRLDFTPDLLRVTVEDDGRGTGPGGEGTGHGMIGMYERARAAGGTLTAGPRPRRGFRVHAELPLPDRTGRKGCR
ncbi:MULTISPECIES: histidine kinase [Kitasatospora]|uniref:histidine kinase n=1 Tax=Kitasatospora setae (strain ATCC 33774 / DSM 43861 / JCM 3304 / KCC A-0304 / NBRC 14216 / KM-6054) TaxID=452652 RepID=E4N0Q3_KITSK|nr:MULTISPECIES: histidine kinase [Kitasatospora]BAJ31737.1 putative two-component system sensor kinase [Kitasatospora setae KM-6054]